MLRLAMILLTCLTLSAPGLAAPFRAENRVSVVSVEGGFAVQSGGGYGARGMWCAAPDYARRVLGATGTARLYVAEGRTPGLGQRAPVRFTMNPAGLDPKGVFIVGGSLQRAGSNLSVDHAHGFCADARMINR